MSVAQILADVIAREGGYVNHPADRGGPTNLGITIGALSEWLGRPATVAEVQALTEAEARAIYTQRYVVGPGLHRIEDEALRAVLVDDAVLSGPEAAVKTLQRSLGVPADGQLGPMTQQAVRRADAAWLVRDVSKQRCLRFGRIVQRDPAQRVFLVGWLQRALSFI